MKVVEEGAIGDKTHTLLVLRVLSGLRYILIARSNPHGESPWTAAVSTV